jgi:hypothetical protein
MTCPMTARLETTIFSVRSLNLFPGAQPNDGKGGAVPNRLTKGCALKGTKGVKVLESNLGPSPQRARVLTAKPAKISNRRRRDFLRRATVRLDFGLCLALYATHCLVSLSM